MNKNEQILKGFADIYNKTVILNKAKMEMELKECKSSEVHCIEYIGKNKDSNVTRLAESFYMTRGAISKLTKKLMEKGYIESYQRMDNNKEIYFKLTKLGQEIYKCHEKLHKEFCNRDKVVFEGIDSEQLDKMIAFVENYNRHLDAELKKQNIDKKIYS